MMTVRRNTERGRVCLSERVAWPDSQGSDADPDGIDRDLTSLFVLDEMRLPPGDGATPRLREGAEIITYVYKGSLAQTDSNANAVIMYAGDFERFESAPNARGREASASATNWAHFFRLSLLSPTGAPGRAREQRRFTAAQRRNGLGLVASGDGRRGSLHVGQDVSIYSSILDAGHHLAYELGAARGAWLHIVHGGASMNGIALQRGDGVGATAEPVLSLTARERTEILLIDLPSRPAVRALTPQRRTAWSS